MGAGGCRAGAQEEAKEGKSPFSGEKAAKDIATQVHGHAMSGESEGMKPGFVAKKRRGVSRVPGRENARLKRLVADLSLDKTTLQGVFR